MMARQRRPDAERSSAGDSAASEPHTRVTIDQILLRVAAGGVAFVTILSGLLFVLRLLGFQFASPDDSQTAYVAELRSLTATVVRNDSVQSAARSRSDSITSARIDALEGVARQLSYSECRRSGGPESQCLPVLLGSGAGSVPQRR